MQEEILPPVAPGTSRDSKKGLFSRIFKKKQEPIAMPEIHENWPGKSLFSQDDLSKSKDDLQAGASAINKLPDYKPAETNDISLDKIRQQLGLFNAREEVSEPLPILKKNEKDQNPTKKEDYNFELPSLEMDDAPDDLEKEAEEEELKAGLEQKKIEGKRSRFTEDLDEPPSIKPKVNVGAVAKPGVPDWTSDVSSAPKITDDLTRDSGFTKPVALKDELLLRPTSDFIKNIDSDMEMVDEEEKKSEKKYGITEDLSLPAIENASLGPAKTSEPAPQTAAIQTSLQKEEVLIGKNSFEKPARAPHKQKKAKASQKQIAPGNITGPKEVAAEENKPSKVEKPEVTDEMLRDRALEILAKERGILQKDKDDFEKQKEALKKDKQSFEQEKITVAGKVNKMDFKEKQLAKSQEDLDAARKDLDKDRQALKEAREQLEKDKWEARDIQQKIPALRDEHDKLKQKLDGLQGQINLQKQQDENLKRRETALAIAQKRLEDMEESIKDKGFQDYLESELKGNKLIASKIPNEDVLKDKNPDFYNLLADCKNLVAKRQFQEAKEAYMKLRSIYQRIPSDDTLKELVYTLIRELYDDINLASMSGK